ncbi:Sterile alpha motif domain [Dillenia turbinata]|uniref:Sterile alpha motif domain n=1 Tax=Dillenia turbinata TaxID=194707 RepID=A0AAN8W0F8_9MAGN
MYADRLESDGARSSVKERLNGSSADDSRRRFVTGKRQRQEDDKWEHDLYDGPQISKRRFGVRDLRLKLQKKVNNQMLHSDKGSQIEGVRDLREKLSGSMHSQPINVDRPKAKSVPEVTKPARKSVIIEAAAAATKKVSSSVPKKKSQQKADTSVDVFLQSLGLEKYSITFQAEEIDMTALIHMTDEDLKALGIPMGPRKKIVLALDSKVQN